MAGEQEQQEAKRRWFLSAQGRAVDNFWRMRRRKNLGCEEHLWGVVLVREGGLDAVASPRSSLPLFPSLPS